MTPQDKDPNVSALAEKIASTELPPAVKQRLTLDAIIYGWTPLQVMAERIKAKLVQVFTNLVGQDEEEDQLEADIARLEGEGGRCAG